MINQFVQTVFMNLKKIVRKIKNNNLIINVIMIKKNIFNYLVSVLLKKLIVINSIL